MEKEFAAKRVEIFEKDLDKTKKQHDELEAEIKEAIEGNQG